MKTGSILPHIASNRFLFSIDFKHLLERLILLLSFSVLISVISGIAVSSAYAQNSDGTGAADGTEPPSRPVFELRPGSSTQVRMTPEQGLALTEKLTREGKYEAAAKLLEGLELVPEDQIDQIEVQFLKGLIALEQERFKEAEDIFREILDNNPKLVRVRLELARSLFGLKRDRAAAYHFRQALASSLPEETQQLVRTFLWLIEQRKFWRINARAAIVPDSNVSAGPRNTTVELFGLPFELDENARRRSGIGLTMSVLGEVFPRLNKFWRLEARAGATFTDYSNRTFDDLNMTAEVGPRYESKGFSVSVLASASRRVFGGNGFNRSFGGRVIAQKGLNRRTVLTLSAGASQVRYDVDVTRDGALYFFAGTIQRSLNAQSLVRGSFTVTRERTKDPTLKNTTFQWRGAYRRELPWGITAEAGPDIFYRTFDEFDFVNNVRREDFSYGASVFITKRDWRFMGFAPVFSYQYLRNESTADRFDFSRHRANVGLTRTF